MMTGLTIVLATSLFLFVSSMLYAVLADWAAGNTMFREFAADARIGRQPSLNFQRAARRPVRVLGSFIF